MATAAIIGGGMLLGGIASGIGASKQAGEQRRAAEANLAAAQAFQDTQAGRAAEQYGVGTQAQNAMMGILGVGGDPEAAQNVLNSPLIQALNEQNQTNISAMSPGMSGGNLLSALQQANTATILQAGLGNLGNIANQGFGVSQGYTGFEQGGLGMGMNAQTQLGEARGAQAAIPWLAGANVMQQGVNLAGFGLGGGFGAGTQSMLQNLGMPQFNMPMQGTSYMPSSAPQAPVGTQGTPAGPIQPNYGIL